MPGMRQLCPFRMAAHAVFESPAMATSARSDVARKPGWVDCQYSDESEGPYRRSQAWLAAKTFRVACVPLHSPLGS